jgi:sugar phosphate permease
MQVPGIERRTIRAVSRRILPFLFVLYVFSYLDRSNVSIAALQMNDELRFSSGVFGCLVWERAYSRRAMRFLRSRAISY